MAKSLGGWVNKRRTKSRWHCGLLTKYTECTLGWQKTKETLGRRNYFTRWFPCVIGPVPSRFAPPFVYLLTKGLTHPSIRRKTGEHIHCLCEPCVFLSCFGFYRSHAPIRRNTSWMFCFWYDPFSHYLHITYCVYMTCAICKRVGVRVEDTFRAQHSVGVQDRISVRVRARVKARVRVIVGVGVSSTSTVRAQVWIATAQMLRPN